MLDTLFRYHAWANAEVLEALAALPDPERAPVLALLDHADIVAAIFRGHLTGWPHGHAGDASPELPDLATLASRIAATDDWYLDFIARAAPEALAEPVAFTFTDGDAGAMTRAEMLLHVALHATVHRGEAARLLRQAGHMPPWETLAVQLHRVEPERRRRAIMALAE